MADFSMQSIECPECKTEQKIKIWESVDVTGNEKNKNKIMSDELFTFTCKKCGHVVPLVYNCLYTDADSRLSVWMLPAIGSEEIEKLPKPSGIGEESEKLAEEYSFRVVDTPNELKEKIIIKDAGMDDRVIELMKMVYLSQLPAITGDEKIADENISEMYFNLTEDGGYCFTVFFENGKELLIGAEKSVYDKIQDDFKSLIEKDDTHTYRKVDCEWSQKMFMAKNAEHVADNN